MGISYVRVKMAGLRFPGDRRHHTLRGVLFLLLASLAVVACSSAPEQDPSAPPPITGIRQYDSAFQLIAPEAVGDRLSVYIDASASLARDGRVQTAAEVLTYAQGLIGSGALGQNRRVLLEARMVAAWQIVASRDETRVETVNNLTGQLLDRADAFDDAELHAEVFRTIFGAQLDNPNAGEAAIRRTLDLAYLIDSDPVRSETLVYAAEQVEGRDDRVALNPLVQQAIATVPALENPLLAADLSARLAVLSEVLDRPQDVSILVGRILRRSQSGLIVDELQDSRLRRLVSNLVAVGSGEDVPQVLANVAPQFMRALAFGWYAAALWDYGGNGTDAFAEAYRLALEIGNTGTEAATRASLIRLRSEYDGTYVASDAAATLLADVRLASIPAERREMVLSDLSVAYVLTDRSDMVSRLRGLIASGDEFARINIRIAERLEQLGRDDAAVTYLRNVDQMPPPGISDNVAPGYRAAQVWQALGEHDRAISAVLSSTPVDVASILALIPASHDINPATRGQLARRVENTSL